MSVVFGRNKEKQQTLLIEFYTDVGCFAKKNKEKQQRKVLLIEFYTDVGCFGRNKEKQQKLLIEFYTDVGSFARNKEKTGKMPLNQPCNSNPLFLQMQLELEILLKKSNITSS